GVMALGKADRRCYAAKVLVLLEQPRALEIPPFDAVEKIVEPGIGKGQDGLSRRAEVLSAEDHVGRSSFGLADQLAPDFGGHLVGRTAAKAAETERDIVAHQLLKIGQDLTLLRRPVIELGEIAPDGPLAGVSGVGGIRRNDVASGVARE